MRWGKVVEVAVVVVVLAGVVGVDQDAWAAERLPGPAATAYAPVVGIAKRTW